MPPRNPSARPQLVALEARETPAASVFIGVGGTPDGVSTTYFWQPGSASATTTATQGTTFQWFGASSTFPVREAVGDINGDGVPDVALVAGPGGGSLVGLVNGAGGVPLVSTFNAFEPTFTGGLYHTLGDIDGDGKNELVVVPDVGGGARVQVFSFSNGKMVQRDNFFGIDDTSFRGGARVALADLNGDGRLDLTVAAGFGGGPRVAVFDGKGLLQNAATPPKLTGDFFAFPGDDATRLRNGVFVAGGDFNADGKDDLAFGGGPGGGPRVFVLAGSQIAAGQVAQAQNAPIANFFAANNTSDRGGVRVQSADIDGDGKLDLALGSGEGLAPRIRTYLGKTLAQSSGTEPPLLQEFNPYSPAPQFALSPSGTVVLSGTVPATFTNGVFVG